MDSENKGYFELFEPNTEETALPLDWKTVLVAALVGMAAGVAMYLAGLASMAWIPAGLLFGTACSISICKRVPDPGRGMIWGLGFSFLTALVLFGLDNTVFMRIGFQNRARVFPNIIKITLGMGAPVGLVLGGWNAVTKNQDREPIKVTRGVITGGLAGLIAGLIIQPWLADHGINILIADFLGDPTGVTGFVFHLFVTTSIGIIYGLLFQRDARGFGSSIAWGFAYGFFWWMLGVMTLEPLINGQAVTWSVAEGQQAMSSFVAHGLYGVLLGLIYSVFDHIWIIMFYESDPLYMSVRGPGYKNIQSLKWGSISAIPGGIIYTVFVWQVGLSGYISGIIGMDSAVAGVFVTMFFAVVIGMIYGVLFRYESPNLGTAVVWGFIYGVIWWYVGVLTLLPLIVQGSPLWDQATIDHGIPLLIAQMAYGSITAGVFYIFEYREKAWECVDPNTRATEEIRRRKVGTSAPAVWMFTLGMAVFVLLLLM